MTLVLSVNTDVFIATRLENCQRVLFSMWVWWEWQKCHWEGTVTYQWLFDASFSLWRSYYRRRRSETQPAVPIPRPEWDSNPVFIFTLYINSGTLYQWFRTLPRSISGKPDNETGFIGYLSAGNKLNIRRISSGIHVKYYASLSIQSTSVVGKNKVPNLNNILFALP
jgi:hypothetical protein